MTFIQWLTLGYTLLATVGLVVGLVLLRRMVRARTERQRRRLNGVVSLLILKRVVRYSLISLALGLLAFTGFDVLFTAPPHPEAVFFLLAQPVVLTGYLIFDFLSERKVDEGLRSHHGGK